MTDLPNERQQKSTDDLPFVAPCRTLSPSAPFRWLSLGWRDIRTAPLPSLSYGLALTLMSAGVVLASWKYGTLALYLGLASGFVFVGPLLAMGLYSVSREIEAHDRPSLWSSWREGRSHAQDMLLIGLCLLVVL